MGPPAAYRGRDVTLQRFWIRQRWVDVIPPVAIIGVWALGAHAGWLPYALTDVPSDSRRTIYQILASIAVTMSGVTLTSISLLLTILQIPRGSDDRVTLTADRNRIGAAFIAVLPWLGTLFVVSTVCIATDVGRQGGYGWLQLVLIGIAVAAVCAICRVIWILRQVLRVAAGA